MNDRKLMQINKDWRLATDDKLQWILQRRQGNKNWVGRKFHMERDSLISQIEEQFSPADAAPIIKVVANWPKYFRPNFETKITTA